VSKQPRLQKKKAEFMGGSGGGFGLSDGQLKSLEERAREALRRNDQPERRNVFLSFCYEDIDEVNLLRGQAKNENSNLEFNDWSLREPFESENAEYIRRGIRERIRQSSVTVVYLSEHTAASRWVDWEIRQSISLGKGVVGVYKGDTPPPVLPSCCNEFSVRLVPWKHHQIGKALEQAANSGSSPPIRSHKKAR
jgi:hypothetical protein